MPKEKKKIEKTTIRIENELSLQNAGNILEKKKKVHLSANGSALRRYTYMKRV